MRFNAIFSLLMLCCICLALTHGSFNDCCLKYVTRFSRRTQRHVVAYRQQEADGDCNIPAIIFTMKKGREFCANPKESWVRELTKKLDKKKPKPMKQLHGAAKRKH